MNKNQLGRLQPVSVRDVWENEASNFTPWLAEEENLTLLGEILGLELALEGKEKNVGPFKADILCKDTLTGQYVLIENQLQRTDHNHLGQLITYAAGLEAVTIVWIADRFTDEHRAALDWLNEISDESAHFFGLEVELWRIGDSLIAPKFNIVSKPNEWSKSVSQVARRVERGDLTPAQELYLNFWTAFHDFLSKRNGTVKPQKPSSDHWGDFAIGRTGFLLRALLSVQADRVGLSLIIYHPDAKPHYFLLEQEKEEIEIEIGESLEWRPLPDNKESQIRILKFNVGLEEEKNWPEIFKWIVEHLETFNKSFRPRIKQLDAANYIPEEEKNDLS